MGEIKNENEIIIDYTTIQSGDMMHDLIKSTLSHEANRCFDAVKEHLGIKYVVRSRMLNNRFVERAYEEPEIYYNDPKYLRKIDLVWKLTDKRDSLDTYTVDWHCIYHEIKTGKVDVEAICRKYLGKHGSRTKDVGATDSPLWIWGYDFELTEARKGIASPYIRKKEYMKAIRLVPIEWIQPILRDRALINGITLTFPKKEGSRLEKLQNMYLKVNKEE